MTQTYPCTMQEMFTDLEKQFNFTHDETMTAIQTIWSKEWQLWLWDTKVTYTMRNKIIEFIMRKYMVPHMIV